MKPEDYISLYGGKAGGWFYLRDMGGFDRNLLPLVYLARDQDMSVVLGQFPENFERQIVRGTHPNDHEGLVDVLRTKKDITTRSNLQYAIESIRENAQSEAVRSYNRYEGQDYDGNVGIMIQPMNPSLKRGSLVEHPHKRETYLIDFVDESYEIPTIGRVVVSGNSINVRGIMRPPTDEIIREIVQLYRRVRDSGFISEDKSFQMEYGLNDRFKDKDEVLFYQARPFKRFEEAPFKLDKEVREYDCFGITPEGGLVLDVVRTWNGEGANEMEQPFAMIVDNMSCQFSCQVQPKNLVAFLPIGPRVNSLEHNTYRWLRKAKVSLLSVYRKYSELQTGDRLKIVCDGLSWELQKI